LRRAGGGGFGGDGNRGKNVPKLGFPAIQGNGKGPFFLGSIFASDAIIFRNFSKWIRGRSRKNGSPFGPGAPTQEKGGPPKGVLSARGGPGVMAAGKKKRRETGPPKGETFKTGTKGRPCPFFFNPRKIRIFFPGRKKKKTLFPRGIKGV